MTSRCVPRDHPAVGAHVASLAKMMSAARGIAAPVARRTAHRALSTGAEGFTRLEHMMWESSTAPYADMFAPLTGQAAAPLVDAARVVAGQRVLDVATGPGQTARYAAKRGAEEVIALDFSEEMLAVAERLTRPSVRVPTHPRHRLPSSPTPSRAACAECIPRHPLRSRRRDRPSARRRLR